MAYAPSTVAKGSFTAEAPVRKRPSFFSRFVTAMNLARQRQAEREIERYLRNNKFTDEVEREIERRFLSGPPRF
jgi:hypothetical protein